MLSNDQLPRKMSIRKNGKISGAIIYNEETMSTTFL